MQRAAKATRQTSINRAALLGLAHLAAKQLKWDEDFRKAQQLTRTGKSSCKDMTDSELLDWCWHLKRLGAIIGIPHPPRRGGKSWDRPTPRQLGEIEQLALQFGWDGLDDKRLLAFVARTAKVDDVRFLLRWQATSVITGLRRWKRQIEKRGEIRLCKELKEFNAMSE